MNRDPFYLKVKIPKGYKFSKQIPIIDESLLVFDYSDYRPKKRRRKK